MSKRRGRPSDKKEYVSVVVRMLGEPYSDQLVVGLNKMTCTELAILGRKISEFKGVSLILPSETPAQKERLEKIEETVAND